MKFCENCNAATNKPFCPFCGTTKLRDVADDDFCFLAETQGGDGAKLADMLEENGIPYSAMPYGSGTESRLALPLSGYRIYVPYRFLKTAESLMAERSQSGTDAIKRQLIENVDKLNVLPATEKKIRKKMKLPADEDFFDYCIGVIDRADEITDGGLITGCKHNGHYLFCRTQSVTLAINSRTYEIIALTKN